ncbi:hypothetical protein EIP91_006233 [Steccherinum ochraceum]|uniref:Uncharacterized protein n=1 Tax=Steccherinum ochraceum TaxID=92696 RepID=A0A4R0R8I6_9APHY|nr:hypothetical protein EIP91_006233 [Steccherinum ochraceum]
MAIHFTNRNLIKKAQITRICMQWHVDQTERIQQGVPLADERIVLPEDLDHLPKKKHASTANVHGISAQLEDAHRSEDKQGSCDQSVPADTGKQRRAIRTQEQLSEVAAGKQPERRGRTSSSMSTRKRKQDASMDSDAGDATQNGGDIKRRRTTGARTSAVPSDTLIDSNSRGQVFSAVQPSMVAHSSNQEASSSGVPLADIQEDGESSTDLQSAPEESADVKSSLGRSSRDASVPSVSQPSSSRSTTASRTHSAEVDRMDNEMAKLELAIEQDHSNIVKQTEELLALQKEELAMKKRRLESMKIRRQGLENASTEPSSSTPGSDVSDG